MWFAQSGCKVLYPSRCESVLALYSTNERLQIAGSFVYLENCISENVGRRQKIYLRFSKAGLDFRTLSTSDAKNTSDFLWKAEHLYAPRCISCCCLAVWNTVPPSLGHPSPATCAFIARVWWERWVSNGEVRAVVSIFCSGLEKTILQNYLQCIGYVLTTPPRGHPYVCFLRSSGQKKTWR